ncbi:MAG: recombinase family protein [Muribaculaceae bacterium]|nr:recombinase family protein [Muribaculaceae bacterium]
MKKAIIYARVSSIGERQSTARQVADLTRYAGYANMTVEKIFEEHISGAKKNRERPVLTEAINYAKVNNITQVLVSELSRLGRNAFEVLLTVKELIDAKINIYFQKEQFTLLDDDDKPSLFAPIMIATLSTCAQLERDNIQFRLQSGRKLYTENGGRLGRKAGSTKSKDDKAEEYRNVLRELRRGTTIRRTAKLCDVSASTVARLKKEFDI